MKEPIVMYQMGKTQIFPPYEYPLFLNPQHWVTRYLLTEIQYKEMIDFEIKHLRRNGIDHHDERGTIAKWKIHLK